MKLHKKIMSAILFAASALPASAANWSQWNDNAITGVSEGYYKVGFASYLQSNLAAGNKENSVNIGGQLEAFVSDNWGLGFQAYGQAFAENKNQDTSSFLLSVKYHFLDRSPVNFFLGSLAGLSHMQLNGSDNGFGESIGGTVGLSFYYWGSFFAEVQSDIVRYQYMSNGSNVEFNSYRTHLVVGVMY